MMQRRSKVLRIASLVATFAMSSILVGIPAMAATSTVAWDFSGGLRLDPPVEIEIAQLALAEPAGAECTAEVESSNGESIHPDNNINVYLNGALLVTIQDIEQEPFQMNVASEDFVSSGADVLVVTLEAERDRGTSSAGSLTVTCTPPPPGGGDGCTPGYWKQPHHFDSWEATGYAPADSFDAVFGVDSSFETLLDGVGATGGGENALARHAVAALLNASNPDVDYAYSAAEVIASVQDAYASGDFEGAKDALAEQNELGCPLN